MLDKRGKSWGMAGRGRGGGGGRGPGGPPFARELAEYTCPRCGVTGDHFEKDCPSPDRTVKRVRCPPNGAAAALSVSRHSTLELQ